MNLDPNQQGPKYDPPLALDKLPEHLKSDPLHRWRAEHGIELIHEEPSWEEFERIRNNWNLMTPEQKALSDAKAVELFGLGNEDHAKRLRIRMLIKRLAKRWKTDTQH